MLQLHLFETQNDELSTELNNSNIETKMFSHDRLCDDTERVKLEKRYIGIVDETDIFNRRIVSYQANKNQSIHQWLKYREGFSSHLVENLIMEFGLQPGDTILDPFMGSGTTALTAKMLGMNSVGCDILPISHLANEAKGYIFDYNIDELEDVYERLSHVSPNNQEVQPFPHIRTTEGAFAQETERELMFYTKWLEESKISVKCRVLMKLILTSILEEISFTRKDGQYLRWDKRSNKVIEGNKRRVQKGKEPFKTLLDKGTLPTVKESLLNALEVIIKDIKIVRMLPVVDSNHELLEESVLTALPIMPSDQFNAVITSPPYCNRYDYTRTYALELAYFGLGEDGVKRLRQEQISCTVENKSKLNRLQDYYNSIGQENRYIHIQKLLDQNRVLKEINTALETRAQNGDINNKGVLQMVNGYFTELTFTYYELFRTCKSGAKVAFVNDNVRYAGEIIPVDFLSTQIAEDIGFKPLKVYTLKQRKGNSSQQMKRYGRAPLRKSITVWEKP